MCLTPACRAKALSAILPRPQGAFIRVASPAHCRPPPPPPPPPRRRGHSGMCANSALAACPTRRRLGGGAAQRARRVRPRLDDGPGGGNPVERKGERLRRVAVSRGGCRARRRRRNVLSDRTPDRVARP